MKQMYVYMLRCNDGSYYTGVTNDVVTRVHQHNQGLTDSYTSKRRPVLLVFYESFQSPKKAIAREKQLKGWTRKKKEALMNFNDDLLHELSACQNDTHFNR